MAKHLQATVEVHNSLAYIREQLLNPAVLERIAVDTGALRASARVEGTQSVVERFFPVPSAARSFLAFDELQVTETRTWHEAHAEVTATIIGVAVSAMGRITWSEGDGNTTFSLDALVEANMGFVGMFAESMVVDRLQEVFAAELGALH